MIKRSYLDSLVGTGNLSGKDKTLSFWEPSISAGHLCVKNFVNKDKENRVKNTFDFLAI